MQPSWHDFASLERCGNPLISRTTLSALLKGWAGISPEMAHHLVHLIKPVRQGARELLLLVIRLLAARRILSVSWVASSIFFSKRLTTL